MRVLVCLLRKAKLRERIDTFYEDKHNYQIGKGTRFVVEATLKCRQKLKVNFWSRF